MAQRRCGAPGCRRHIPNSSTRPSHYCSHACQQKAHRLRRELDELAGLHRAYEAVQALIADLGEQHPLADAWRKFARRAERRSNLFRQLHRGRGYMVMTEPHLAGSQEPGSSSHAQGGTRIGDGAALGREGSDG